MRNFEVLSTPKRVRTILVLGRKMPAIALQAANTLSVEFKDEVIPEA